MDITICGNFAGVADIFTSTGCMGVCSDLAKTPSNYDNAYFEILYTRVFQQGSGGGGTAGADSSTSTSGSASTYSVTAALVLATLGFGLSFLAA